MYTFISDKLERIISDACLPFRRRRQQRIFAEFQKTFQYGMIIVIAVVDSKGQYRKILDRDISQIFFAGRKNIRIQSIAQTCLYQN